MLFPLVRLPDEHADDPIVEDRDAAVAHVQIVEEVHLTNGVSGVRHGLMFPLGLAIHVWILLRRKQKPIGPDKPSPQ